MDELRGSLIDELPFSNFEWELDLYGFDGPLLSQFTSSSGEKYLMHWCDCDELHNRWMILPVTENSRIRLIARKNTLREIVDEAKRNFVFIVDTRSDGSFASVMLVEGKFVPASYIPGHDSYIDVDDPSAALGIGTASLLFDGDWEIESVRNFMRAYRQAYNFTLGLSRDLISRLEALPWQGGFSAVHFFDRLDDKVRKLNTGQIETELMQFASPGIVQFKVDSSAAATLVEAIFHYDINKK